MTLDPRSNEFWDIEEERLWDVVRALALASFLAGSDFGLDQLPPQASLLVDPDQLMIRVEQFLNQFRLTDIAGINETTRNRSIEAINEWLISGEPISGLEERLKGTFGEGRAGIIAATSVTAAFSQGQIAGWLETGVVGLHEWTAVIDSETTPICVALNGQVRRLRDDFVVPSRRIAQDDPAGLREMVAEFGDRFIAPPAHPNCRSRTLPHADINLFERRLDEVL